MSHAEACAKIILFGEHAVVYGHPAIALPVSEISTIITVEDAKTLYYTVEQELTDEQKDDLRKLIDLIFLQLDIDKNVRIHIESSIPIASGLGSSASLSIALIRALSEHFMLELSKEAINGLAMECEKLFHGNPSGIDNTVITYEKPVFFEEEHTFLEPGKVFQLFIIQSGELSHTKEAVEKVRAGSHDDVLSQIGNLTRQGKALFEQGNLGQMGILMVRNHSLLQQLGVSTPQVDALVQRAMQAGAYGAKLSGGGLGGNVIALADESNKDRLAEAFKDAAYTVAVIE